MRRTWCILVALLATGVGWVAFPPPAQAEAGQASVAAASQPIALRMEVFNLGEAGAGRIGDVIRVRPGLMSELTSNGQARRVQSLEMLALPGLDASIHVGRQDPFVYYDARNSQFQIQYVDTGIKMFLRTRMTGTGILDMDISPELAPVETRRSYGDPAGGTAYVQTQILTTKMSLSGVRFGDSVVVARAHGAFVSRLLATLLTPAAALQAQPARPSLGDDLVVVITVTKP